MERRVERLEEVCRKENTPTASNNKKSSKYNRWPLYSTDCFVVGNPAFTDDGLPMDIQPMKIYIMPKLT